MKIQTAVEMKADKKIGRLYLYDDIQPDWFDWWTDEKIQSETSATTVAAKLEEMGAVSELNVYICSRGGDVATGNAIYAQLQRMNVPKTAYIDGLAASIATVIPCACDKIVMCRTGIYMIHNASMGMYGNAAELRKAADVLDTYTAAARQAYVARCKISEDEITALMNDETYMTAAEALERGFIDEIADTPPADTDAPKEYLGASAAMRMNGGSKSPDMLRELCERMARIENMLAGGVTAKGADKAEDKDGVPEDKPETPENKGSVPEDKPEKPKNGDTVHKSGNVEDFLRAFLV